MANLAQCQDEEGEAFFTSALAQLSISTTLDPQDSSSSSVAPSLQHVDVASSRKRPNGKSRPLKSGGSTEMINGSSQPAETEQRQRLCSVSGRGANELIEQYERLLDEAKMKATSADKSKRPSRDPIVPASVDGPVLSATTPASSLLRYSALISSRGGGGSHLFEVDSSRYTDSRTNGDPSCLSSYAEVPDEVRDENMKRQTKRY
jgi:hypothetical protein